MQKMVESLAIARALELNLMFVDKGVNFIQLWYHAAVIFLRRRMFLLWNMVRKCIQAFDVLHQSIKYVSLKLYIHESLTKMGKYSNRFSISTPFTQSSWEKGSKVGLEQKINECVPILDFYSLKINEVVFFH